MNERSVATLERSPTGARPSPPGGPRLALVGTYPPTLCGIASFTASLRKALMQAGASRVDIVRVLQDGDEAGAGPEVMLGFRPAEPQDVRRAAASLTAYDAVVVQHEFGIYGPRSGMAVIDLVRACRAPVVVTLHTVTEDLTDEQVHIVESLVAMAASTVVLSEAAARILVSRYGIDPARVEVIPHGSEESIGVQDREPPPGMPEADPLLLTWGLIGPGKGLDWAVGALPLVKERLPDVHWVIAGQTHPKVAAQEGERYRHGLEQSIEALEVGSHVTLLDAYLTRGQIRGLAEKASAVVLPYDSTQQTSSGVLVEAVAAGVPVVSTAFPQAVEVAAKGGALVVPHRDVDALAGALVRIATDRATARRMVAAQRSMAASVDWQEVGAAYLALVASPVTAVAS